MKSNIFGTAVCIASGFFACCNKQSTTKPEARTIQKASPNSKSNSGFEQKEISSVSFRDVANRLRKIRSSGTSSGFEELKTDLLALAEHEGTSPMTIASRLALEAENEDDQEWVLIYIQIAFPDINSQTALANAIPAGRLRSFTISRLSSQLAQSGDLDGMRKLYGSIPIGKDRRQLSIDAASLTLAKLGLPSALDFVANLEMPDERFVAYQEIVTNENLKQYTDDKSIAAKRAAIIATFDEQHRKIYSLSNRKWH